MERKLVEVSSVQKGSTIVIDGAACKVTDLKISRPGKHGHAKVNLTAVGLLDEKKRTMVLPGHDTVEVPIIEKKNAQVLSIHGDMGNLMDAETFETFDLKIPAELKDQIVEGSTVLYWVVLGEKVIKQVKPE